MENLFVIFYVMKGLTSFCCDWLFTGKIVLTISQKTMRIGQLTIMIDQSCRETISRSSRKIYLKYQTQLRNLLQSNEQTSRSSRLLQHSKRYYIYDNYSRVSLDDLTFRFGFNAFLLFLRNVEYLENEVNENMMTLEGQAYLDKLTLKV